MVFLWIYMNKLHHFFFEPRFTFNRFQFNLIALFLLTFGFGWGTFFTLKYVPQIFASTQSSVTKNTDTDFSQGTLSSTVTSGSGSSAVLKLSGGGGPASTLYKRAITVDNTAVATTFTNLQVLVTIDTAALITAGKLQSDCDDIRFLDADDSTAIDYFLQSGCNTTTTKIWVEVPTISASASKTIYMYYGSSGASSASSLANTLTLPSAVSGSNLKMWLKADAITNLNDGEGVPTWFDSSGNGQDAIQGNSTLQPLYKTNILNGYPVVRGDGSNDLMTNTTIGAVLHSATQGSIIVVANLTGDTSYGLMGFPTYIGYWRYVGDGNGYFGVMRGVRLEGTPTAMPTTGAYIFSTVSGASTYTIHQNGVSKASTTTSWINPGTLVLFNETTPGYFAGDLAEVIIYNTGLSAADRQTVERYVGAKYAIAITQSNVPSVSVGSESSTIASSGTYESPTDSNVIDLVWNGGWGDGTNGSTAFSATVANVGASNTIAFQMRVATTTGGLSSASYVSLGTANTGTTFTKTKAELDSLGLSTGTARYVQVKATLAQSNGTNPELDSFTIYYMSDNTAPESNASSVAMLKSSGGASVSSNGWANNLAPYFSWTAGSDSESGIKGYCLYLGTDSSGNPASAKGLLGTSPVSITGSTCQFIVSATSIDFATTAYRGSTWLTSSTSPYYIIVKAIDTNNNIAASSVSFQFRFDNTNPSNPSYLSLPGDFISTESATLIWPTSGGDAAADTHSGLVGLQYRIGSSGTWYGDSHSGTEDSTDVLTNDGSYETVQNPDFTSIAEGSNLVYLRAWDTAGNVSTTYVSAALKVNTTAPSAPQNLAVTPETNTTNEFAFSWDAPVTYTGEVGNITYCYTVNTVPTLSSCTFTDEGVTSLDEGAFATQPGENTFYVVAKDEAGNLNYDTYASVTFTSDTSAPGIPRSVDVSDISIKATSNWKLTITWDPPTDLGSGVSSYKVYRSTTGTSCSSSFSSFAEVGSTAGSSYADTSLSQTTYYYCVKACDSANNCSAVSSTVSKLPDGKYTTAAGLASGPTASSVTTKKAVITWSTDRASDSKIAYGIASGSYNDEEPSNSTQVTSHTINLTNLSPGTTYYYKAKWTDEDGNTGISDEKTFTTDPAPTVTDPHASLVGLSTAVIDYTVKSASKVKIYYGATSSFGGLKEVSTSTSETTYTTTLEGLEDGTKYFYKINTVDSEGSEYEGSILTFETLPRPRITQVRLQEIKGTAQPTVLVSWETNTEVSSIITYYPESDPSAAQDEVNVTLTKGTHRMLLRGLRSQSFYVLVVKGRDKQGNEATSDTQRFTTATDSRPPQLLDLHVEGSTIPSVTSAAQKSIAQLVVFWNTDEPSTSQVEFGEGTGTTYSQKSQEDKNLTTNHLVIISGLTPSKVYHLRAISHDGAGNQGTSIDTVTITPKTTENALNLVIGNLQDVFSIF